MGWWERLIRPEYNAIDIGAVFGLYWAYNQLGFDPLFIFFSITLVILQSRRVNHERFMVKRRSITDIE